MILVAYVAAGIFLGRVQNDARNAGRIDPVSGAITKFVSVVASPIRSASEGVSGFLAGFQANSENTQKAARLKSVEVALSLYDERISYLESEISKLRKLNQLPSWPGKTKVPAIVSAYFPLESRFLLNKGRAAGIKPGMPVVSVEGLVGVIQNANDSSSYVLLVSSPQLRIGAVVQRDASPAGLIRGENPSKMVLEISETNANIQAGDAVLTSGHSELIPGGIPIGIVAEKVPFPEFGTVRCMVFPNFQPGDIREVVVLR